MLVRKSFLIFLIVIVSVSLFLWCEREKMLTRGTELVLSHTSQDVLSGPIKIQSVTVDQALQLHMHGFSSRLKTQHGPVPINIEQIDSQGSLLGLLGWSPVVLQIHQLLIADTVEKGIWGTMVIEGGKKWTLDFRGIIAALDLKDVSWLDPDHLKGATGRMEGSLRYRVGMSEDPSLEIDLRVKEPGGRLQSDFFSLLTPYLPQSAAQITVNKLATDKRLIQYSNARLLMRTIRGDKLKGILHILAREVNLDLNLSFEIRVDEHNAFFKLSQILGQIGNRAS